MERISKQDTINTADFEGFKEVHQTVLEEVDRDVTGKIIDVSRRNLLNWTPNSQNVFSQGLILERKSLLEISSRRISVYARKSCNTELNENASVSS